MPAARARQFFRRSWPYAAAIATGAGLALTPYGIERLVTTSPAAALSLGAGETRWIDADGPTSSALQLLSLLREAPSHGLDPARYEIAQIEAALSRSASDRASRARAERLLSEAFIAYARDLRVPASRTEVAYIDPELAPAAPNAEELLAAPVTADALTELQQFSPLYEELRSGLAWYRGRWSKLPQIEIPPGPPLALGSRDERVTLLRQRLGVPAAADADRFDERLGEAVREFRQVHGLASRPVADSETIKGLNAGAAHYERLIVANMDRARGLPADGRRHVLVDSAGAMLQMMEGGRQVDTMRVVVGKPEMATPELAGFIRYAVFEPYWNVPPDLVRSSIAPQVLQEGAAALAARKLVLSPDWRSYTRLEPSSVDWASVAAGDDSVWVRQLPGGDNMMGRVKFMLPNRLGIYLHDTPDKALFGREDRRLSSGCVRVEDAERLAQWLFRDRDIMDGTFKPDQRIDVPEPIPVYITYFTAVPQSGEIRFHKDAYRRDGELLARLGTTV